MTCKKSLSAILSLVMVVTMVLSVVVMPVHAAATGGNVPFGSPAITADVGETIDLTKYGVEFAEGQVTDNGLSWWNSTNANTVTFKKPAILANVGDTVTLSDWNVEFADGVVTDANTISWQKKLHKNTVTFGMPAILTDAGTTVNFADYPVEMTEGNVVSGDKLTWKQVGAANEMPLITYGSPAIPANVGETIDLSKYAVEFENDVTTVPANITWANGDAAVTAFTPAAKGVTALTATANGVSKTIYVVAKEQADTEYTLYLNEFNSAEAVAELTKASYGGGNTSYAYNAETDKLDILRTDTGNRNLFLFLPEWIGEFGDYIVEMNYTALSKYSNNTRYTPLVFRASGSKMVPYYTAWINFNKKAVMQKRTTDAWAFTDLASNESSGVSVAVGTNVTYVADVMGDTVTFSANGTDVLTYDGLTEIRTGRVGLGIVGTSVEVDYMKVSLHPDAIEMIPAEDTTATNYTPATKGVTAFEVTDGETTKTVYVVAKNAEDTEYVLYENDFNEDTDLNDVVHLTDDKSYSGAGTDSIVDGKWRFVRAEDNTTSNRLYMLPEWLCDFSDYTLEMDATVNAQGSNTRYLGFLFRGQTGTDSRPYAIIGFQRNNNVNWGHRVSTETQWNPVWYTAKTNAYTIPALGTAATYKMSVNADAVKVYYNGTEVAATTLPDEAPDKGRPGIMSAGVDFDIDNYKVTLTEPEKIAAVDTFTPVEAGVTEFIATVNGVSKSVYVVAKEADDTEYVLYENNFDSAASLGDITRLSSTAEEKYPIGYSDGNLTVTRVGVTSAQTTMAFPAWLSAFGDYTIESSISIDAQTNNTRYYALVFRGNADFTTATPYYTSIYNRAGTWRGQRRLNTTNSDWNKQWDNWAGPSVDGAFTPVALGTYATHKVEVSGDTATAYYNGTQVGTYTPTDVRDTGFVGLFFHSVDAKVDYFKVTLSAQEIVDEQITTFTPQVAGVTPLTVKDAQGNEKTVYVVAKEAADTEYVLYENDFNNPSDVNKVSLVEGNATLSVENGALNVAASTAYVQLPALLGDFGDYKMEMVATTDAYGSNADWIAFTARGQHADSGKEAYVAQLRHHGNKWNSIQYNYRDASGTLNRYAWGNHAAISTGSEHTYTLVMKDDLLTLQQDGTYVFYQKDDKKVRTGYLGFALSNVTLSVNSIRVTVEDTEKPNAPLGATFTPDAGLPYGTIAGTLQVSLDTAGEKAVDVAYYWGDGNGKLAGYAAFDEILVGGKTAVTDTIPAGTVVPAGATELRVYTANEAGESDTCVTIPLPISVRNMATGEETLSFQVGSDTHIMPKDYSANADQNAAHLADLLQDIAKFDENSAGFFQGGDIVDNGKVTEYQYFKEVWDANSNGLALEGIIGNHEYWYSDEYADTVNNFATYTGIPITPEQPYYTKNVNGYDFFFLNSSIKNGTGSAHNIAVLGEAQLTWLAEEMAAKAQENKPMFVFHHQKFNQISEAEQLQAIFAQYPQTVFLTSHTHNDMNTAGIFEYANDTMCNTANTSSVSYTVYTHYNPYGENTHDRSQVYYVEVYEDRVLFRGMDILTNEWLPSAQFVFWYGDVDTYPTDANLYPAANAEDATFTFDASAVPAVGDDGFTAADTDTVAALEGKFNFYYDREGAHYRERDLFDNLDTNDNYNPTGTETGWSKWVPSGEWLTRETGKTKGEMFRKIDTLVPLNANGDEIVLQNFETTFNVKFAGTYGGAILAFRQQEPGHFTTGYYNLVKTTGFVTVNKNGMSIASGNDIVCNSSGDATTDMYNHYETAFATALPDTVTVKVRAVGSDITVEIYDYATQQLLHTENDTLSYLVAGAVGYGVSAVGHSIGDITLTKLNSFGTPADMVVEGHKNGTVETVDVEKTENGYRYTVEVTPDAGYELRAGSLLVEDKDGNFYVPTRVGFRQGGDATRYTVTIKGEGAVYASFYKPTAQDPNIGNLGTSINPTLVGLRFVSRFTRVVENGTEYIVFGNEKLAVADYGMLMGIDTVIGDNELTVEYAEGSRYIQKMSVKQSGIYYDACADYVDMSVCITGVDKVNGGADLDVVSRTYIILKNGDVLYGNAWSSSYNETLGM